MYCSMELYSVAFILCGKLDNGPKRHPGSNPWNVRMVLYIGKMDFAGVIKIRMLGVP